jgi:hypothetical protein
MPDVAGSVCEVRDDLLALAFPPYVVCAQSTTLLGAGLRPRGSLVRISAASVVEILSMLNRRVLQTRLDCTLDHINHVAPQSL